MSRWKPGYKVWKKCRKKPVEVHFREVKPEGETIQTLEGKLHASPDEHYIIRGVNGEVYPIRKEIFEATYEVVEE